MNRASADRLVQAETLQVLLGGKSLRAKVAEAWRKVLLYSEHTWGAWCSISDPDSDFTRDQWEVKRGFAEEADRLSREVMEEVVSVSPSSTAGTLWG
jgi:alpha-mannosidase